MAISLVGQTGQAGGVNNSPDIISYSSTGGNTLIITGHLFDNTNNAFVVPTSITDSAGNFWRFSTNGGAQATLTAQTPPICSLTDPSDAVNAHQSNWVAWSVNAAAVTSVTLNWGGGVSTWRRYALSEWSGISYFDNSWAGGNSGGASSVISGPVMMNNVGELVVGVLDFGGGGTESLPPGWTALTGAGAVGDNGYFLPGGVGTYTPVWSNTISASWTGALAVFSPVPPPYPLGKQNLPNFPVALVSNAGWRNGHNW